MSYDDLDRLSTAAGLWGSGSYTYDALGNITSKTEGGETRTYHYDSNNRLTSITGASPVSYGTQDFDYNRAGNMVSSTNPSITYQYDGHKRRVQQTQGGQTEYTMYSQSGTLLHKQVGGVTTDYIYAGQMLIARNNSGTSLLYLHTDLLGSPIEGKAGSTGYTEHYTPWGEKLSDPIQLADDVGYTGHQSDVATGLTYMQARYYDPVVGRFMAVDPVGFLPSNPMSFNTYSYVNNNPYRFTDPSGMVASMAILNKNACDEDLTCTHVDNSSPTSSSSGQSSDNEGVKPTNPELGEQIWRDEEDRNSILAGLAATERDVRARKALANRNTTSGVVFRRNSKGSLEHGVATTMVLKGAEWGAGGFGRAEVPIVGATALGFSLPVFAQRGLIAYRAPRLRQLSADLGRIPIFVVVPKDGSIHIIQAGEGMVELR